MSEFEKKLIEEVKKEHCPFHFGFENGVKNSDTCSPKGCKECWEYSKVIWEDQQ
jgi:hypothetical protein